jgi:hypothetical protein
MKIIYFCVPSMFARQYWTHLYIQFQKLILLVALNHGHFWHMFGTISNMFDMSHVISTNIVLPHTILSYVMVSVTQAQKHTTKKWMSKPEYVNFWSLCEIGNKFELSECMQSRGRRCIYELLSKNLVLIIYLRSSCWCLLQQSEKVKEGLSIW